MVEARILQCTNPRCNHVWQTRMMNPKYCPHCISPLTRHKPIELESMTPKEIKQTNKEVSLISHQKEVIDF